MSNSILRQCFLVLLILLFGLAGLPAWAAERPHGLEPADDMPFIPDLGGLRTKSYKNQYGQVKRLAESVVLRQSNAEGGKVTVPAGGLYYISEVADDAAPLRRDPFFVLGEHAYLVDFKVGKKTVNNISLKKGDKLLLGDAGYRLWFDYATDHYDLPYIQLALISPSGHWPSEFPISDRFPGMHDIVKEKLKESATEPQVDAFYLDKVYEYGASRFEADKVDFTEATMKSLTWPIIEEATFSFSRPWVMDLRQEDYRFYKNKRIYAFRKPEGFLVRVTNFSGSEVLAEKLIRPVTAQGYKDRPDQLDKYGLNIPKEDMRVEILLQGEYLKHSDFTPWSNDVPYGWTDGLLSLVVYSDLMTVKNGQAWPLDERYKVGLEANLMTGKLQRLVLENAAPFTLDSASNSYDGPLKRSDIWDRKFFTLVVNDIREVEAKGAKVTTVYDYYLRDSFFQRTDNLVFDAKKGRRDIDFFIGRAPTFIPILEDTFLTRLADNSLGTVVEPSHFTSFPKVNDNVAFHSPDPTAPFGGLLRGFARENNTNRRGEKTTSAEGLVIRGSYVDWRNKRVVIPPSGLFYTSRNSRNVRTTQGESFLLLGKRAYIATFESTTFVRKNFDLDFWKVQPSGDMNPIFWQVEPLGENNKVLRYTQRALLDDRPMSMVNIVKYSGNNFGAPFIMAQNLDADDSGNRYGLPDLFAEGATWIRPEFIGENYMRIKEFVTPAIANVQFTYEKPERVLLEGGAAAPLGDFVLAVTAVDSQAATVAVELRDKAGKVLEARTLGPLNDEAKAFLPQHQKVLRTIQFQYGPEGNKVMAEMDVNKPFEGAKAGLWLYVKMQKLEHDKPLYTDHRFTVRPDVCGHCYQLNELLFDNPEPIVLDKNNPRFDGPKGEDGKPIFSIVLDSFDGEMIHAWHIETLYRGRLFNSANLAFNPRANVDCLMGVNGTVEGFLRAAMLERSAYREYWRRGVHAPVLRGLDAWIAHKFQ